MLPLYYFKEHWHLNSFSFVQGGKVTHSTSFPIGEKKGKLEVIVLCDSPRKQNDWTEHYFTPSKCSVCSCLSPNLYKKNDVKEAVEHFFTDKSKSKEGFVVVRFCTLLQWFFKLVVFGSCSFVLADNAAFASAASLPGGPQLRLKQGMMDCCFHHECDQLEKFFCLCRYHFYLLTLPLKLNKARKHLLEDQIWS